ncbi:MAG: FG-GAP-like repeat-containing protein, partial [Holophagae bacterium]
MSGTRARFFVTLILLVLLEPALLVVANSGNITPTSAPPDVTVIKVLAEYGGDLAHLIDAGVARPVSLAAGDLDEDGVPDLVVGYGDGLAGHIAVHRGNIEAIYPAPGRQPGAPFLSSPRVFAATMRPDFIAAGDFDADGHLDVVTASRGGGVLELHRGDGDGHLTSADQVELGGVLTAMAIGEVNRRDGHPDVVVGVDGATGSSIVVFESPLGALRGIPETIPVAETVTSLELGNMDEDHFRDILALSESYETTVTGRDRRLSLGAKLRAEVPDAMVSILPRSSTTKNSAPGIDLDLDGEIVAQLAMRLNRDAFPDFVVITDAAKQPVAVTTRTRATFTVNSTADDPDFDTGDGVCDTDDSVGDGPCTLRAAIEQANVSAGADAIEFDISGAPPHVIQPASRLPLITEAITIDGTTEPDFVDAPVVELDGLVAGTPGDLNGLQIESAGNSTIRGLSIYRFDQTGIVVRFVGQNIVEGCIVGTDATGAAGLGNGAAGIGVYTCSDNTIGGTTPSARNIASGNSAGIDAAGESNTIQGNFVGTDPTGTSSLANTVGISIRSPNNTVGGITAGAANVISGNYLTTNQGTGLWISGNSTVDVLVHGNLIGTDAAGTAPLGNEGEGVRIKFSDGIVIGGTSPAMRNVISDNFYGIETESTAANAQIQGNFIGTDVTGTVAVGNLIGVAIASGDGCTVGGAVAGAGNVVSGNDYGVSISTSNNIVQGNLIGTDATGTSAL